MPRNDDLEPNHIKFFDEEEENVAMTAFGANLVLIARVIVYLRKMGLFEDFRSSLELMDRFFFDKIVRFEEIEGGLNKK